LEGALLPSIGKRPRKSRGVHRGREKFVRRGMGGGAGPHSKARQAEGGCFVVGNGVQEGVGRGLEYVGEEQADEVRSVQDSESDGREKKK